MTFKTYIAQLGEKLNGEESKSIDVATIIKLILSYNRRILTRDEKNEFDLKLDEKYVDILVKMNKAKAKKDDATVASISSELLALCSTEVRKVFSEGKTFEDGLYMVHDLVAKREATEKKENIREARLLADRSLENDPLRKDYIAEKDKVEQDNFMLYDEKALSALCARAGATKKEDFAKRLEKVVEADTRYFAQIEDKYLPRVVEEIVKEDIRLSSNANSVQRKL